MDMKLKENKKLDLSKYKVKVIKLFKVLLTVFITLLIFHFATNFKEYRRICIDNDIPVDKYIITNQELEELSNKYLSSQESSNFSSPLDSEKDELKTSINEIQKTIESKFTSIQKNTLLDDEQVKLDELTSDYDDIDYDESEEYKLTKLEDINSKYSALLSELNELDSEIQIRILKKEISATQRKIDKLIEQIADEDITSEETSSYKSIKADYDALDTNVVTLSLKELKLLKADLNDIYDRLNKLDETISKRIELDKKKVEEQALAKQQADAQVQANLEQQENETQEQITSSSDNSNSKTENTNETTEKNTPVEEPVEEETNDMCYSTYEEAQQVGMQTMLNDSSIQKMEVNSSNNCIEYYR
ncbi:hypothetical protein R2F61_07050 [Mollicutes bacterium LVI A0078]|nr:hypothetical protein RZE84_07055 [Mollicutes bacterium LVI A0075]WOO90481.1 hypothetical protein R2F61_07050 [Mollicutes bacterium LVI A0078]